VVYKLKEFDLHVKYQSEFIGYFREICDHKSAQIRKKGAYNLPCMNLLYKSVQMEKQDSFMHMYYTFADDEDEDIRFCAA
jgi:hypothetical protein